MILNESFLQQLPDVKLLTWFQLLTGNNIPLLVSRDVCVSSAIKSFGRQTLNTTDFYVASCRLLSITPVICFWQLPDLEREQRLISVYKSIITFIYEPRCYQRVIK